METVVSNKRKLIDIKMPVFQTLSEEAVRQDISLKRLIENMLETAARDINREYGSAVIAMNPKIHRLIGSAKPKDGKPADIQDERLQYLLSK